VRQALVALCVPSIKLFCNSLRKREAKNLVDSASGFSLVSVVPCLEWGLCSGAIIWVDLVNLLPVRVAQRIWIVIKQRVPKSNRKMILKLLVFRYWKGPAWRLAKAREIGFEFGHPLCLEGGDLCPPTRCVGYLLLLVVRLLLGLSASSLLLDWAGDLKFSGARYATFSSWGFEVLPERLHGGHESRILEPGFEGTLSHAWIQT